jgi:hypothetical protein
MALGGEGDALWWQAPARRADPHWRVGALTLPAFNSQTVWIWRQVYGS